MFQPHWRRARRLRMLPAPGGTMAKKARKRTARTKKARRAKARRPAKRSVRKSSRVKARKRPRKLGSAFQIMIDTINQTERMREKRELRGSDESE